MILFAVIIVVLLSILAVIIQNQFIINLHFFYWQLKIPLMLLIILAVAAGSFLTSVWNSLHYLSWQKVFKEFGNKMKEMQNEMMRKDERIRDLENKIISVKNITGDKNNDNGSS